MELTPEDQFKLNVLLANKPLAIRIDESAMAVYGMGAEGSDTRIDLHSHPRPERYLKTVRELISGHYLGSPGGYPLYISRWTRMGQMRDESLAQLLLLAEREAVVAACCAPGLSPELAERAWWAMEDPDNARNMLANQAIAGAAIGRTLAQYLLDYLPFETETELMFETVRLILQPGLLDEQQVSSLWGRSRRKGAYLAGFLKARADSLPVAAAAHAHWQRLDALPPDLATAPGPALLARSYSAAGQAFWRGVDEVLEKPPTQDVVASMIDILADYCGSLRDQRGDHTLEELQQDAARWLETPEVICWRRLLPGEEPAWLALRVFSGLGYGVLRPVLTGTTANGTLMRKKLQPVLQSLRTLTRALRQ